MRTKPQEAITCRFLNDREIGEAFQYNKRYGDYQHTHNYFKIIQRPDPYTIEGYAGRTDRTDAYFENFDGMLDYFTRYRERKYIYVTFDHTVLYRVINILPQSPLLFILRQINNLPDYENMINQEEIYQLLFRENWKQLLHILHQHKNAIASDSMLQHAAKTFEDNFFQKLDSYSDTDNKITDALDLLYVLHHGNYYRLAETNERKLIIQLVKRKPISESYGYALQFPDEENCKKVINAYEAANMGDTIPGSPTISPKNWLEIYNRLFDLINNKEETATYFSGPKFINVVREVLPFHPDYTQYINGRNTEGKNTSRKIFYYDILFDQPEYVRLMIIQKMLNLLKPFQAVRVKLIEQLLNNGMITDHKTTTPPNEIIHSPVFISYSWDDQKHQEWVLHLAERLRSDGIEVILDRYELTPGKNISFFVERAIQRAVRVIIIFTPNYKLKADHRNGGVGFEYSIMNQSLYENQSDNKFIPVLRSGTMQESIPQFMRALIHIDMTSDATFDNSYNDLLREIYNEPVIQIPAIGPKPDFSKKTGDQ